MWAKRYVPDELLLVFNDDDMLVDHPRAEALLDDTDDMTEPRGVVGFG